MHIGIHAAMSLVSGGADRPALRSGPRSARSYTIDATRSFKHSLRCKVACSASRTLNHYPHHHRVVRDGCTAWLGDGVLRATEHRRERMKAAESDAVFVLVLGLFFALRCSRTCDGREGRGSQYTNAEPPHSDPT